MNEASVTSRTKSSSASSQTALFMGKSINKQAELRRKMQLAKQQKEAPSSSPEAVAEEDGDDSSVSSNRRLSDKEMKERNDRKRFEELLQKSTASAIWNDYATGEDDYKNHEQVLEEIEAQRKGVERLFEGDPAPVDCFANLVIPQTDVALGQGGQERIVPWLGKNANDDDYLIVICDPRPNSPDLQTAVRHLWSDLPAELRQRLVVINADRPSQTRKWFKKQGWTTANSSNTSKGPTVYADEKMEWMRAYTALGEKRWSMTLFVLAGGRVQKLVRDLDVYTVSKVVPKAVAAFQDARL